MNKRKFIKGDVVKNNQMCNAIILNYCENRKGYYLLEFIDDYKFKAEVHISNITRGAFKNPYHKEVCGVGFLGEGNYDSKEYKMFRILWNSMINRCYGKNKAYENSHICEEWFNFQNFAEWCVKNYRDGWELDKDLLSNEKIYSPNTCCFVPRKLNIQIRNNFCGEGYIYNKINKNYRVNFYIDGKMKNIGSYKTIKEAKMQYIKYKVIELYKILSEWKNIIDNHLWEKLKEKIEDYIIKFKYNIESTETTALYDLRDDSEAKNSIFK